MTEQEAGVPAVPGVTRWRKRPVEVEAIRWTGTNLAEVQEFTGGGYFDAVDLEDRAEDPDMTAEVFDKLHSTWVHVYDGQWIIRGIQGELYPCAADVFAATYEPADAALPVAAVLDRPTIDGEPSGETGLGDDTSRALTTAEDSVRPRAGAVAGEGSDGTEGEDGAALDAHVPVRFPEQLAAAAKRLAAQDGVSTSAWIRRVVDRELAARPGRYPACGTVTAAIISTEGDEGRG